MYNKKNLFNPSVTVKTEVMSMNLKYILPYEMTMPRWDILFISPIPALSIGI